MDDLWCGHGFPPVFIAFSCCNNNFINIFILCLSIQVNLLFQFRINIIHPLSKRWLKKIKIKSNKNSTYFLFYLYNPRMPTSLSKLQLGGLKRLTSYIEYDLITNPFIVELAHFQTCFSRNRHGTFDTVWDNVFTDLEAYALFG